MYPGDVHEVVIAPVMTGAGATIETGTNRGAITVRVDNEWFETVTRDIEIFLGVGAPAAFTGYVLNAFAGRVDWSPISQAWVTGTGTPTNTELFAAVGTEVARVLRLLPMLPAATPGTPVLATVTPPNPPINIDGFAESDVAFTVPVGGVNVPVVVPVTLRSGITVAAIGAVALENVDRALNIIARSGAVTLTATPTTTADPLTWAAATGSLPAWAIPGATGDTPAHDPHQIVITVPATATVADSFYLSLQRGGEPSRTIRVNITAMAGN